MSFTLNLTIEQAEALYQVTGRPLEVDGDRQLAKQGEPE
jgi:hypothetical protein